ncbi:hypothetical protein AZL_b04510 (plasmid) [Azospirillum sp. B510]|uniref:hypothetical protein n=1 Tax=Azospirillum sp. (strain B510) TaxID=137722 RepID=UPI0001C4C7CD|nr:hypothetical protein [Azospirillum sp. B510]BAI75114.1 hypothetical protein AZL_b04510 [Azospirillum sp. B510]
MGSGRQWTIRALRGGFLAAVALLAGSCANPQAELALRAPRTMVGMSKGALLSCAGVPDRSTVSGDVEYLVYTRKQTLVDRDVDWEPSPWLGPRGPMLWRPDVTTWSRTYRCEATFEVKDGRITALRYNEDRDPTLCYPIVGNCAQ